MSQRNANSLVGAVRGPWVGAGERITRASWSLDCGPKLPSLTTPTPCPAPQHQGSVLGSSPGEVPRAKVQPGPPHQPETSEPATNQCQAPTHPQHGFHQRGSEPNTLPFHILRYISLKFPLKGGAEVGNYQGSHSFGEMGTFSISMVVMISQVCMCFKPYQIVYFKFVPFCMSVISQ